MTRHFLTTIAALALAAPLSVTSAAATTIIIDNFTVAQTVIDDGNLPTDPPVSVASESTVTTMDGSILGGSRYMKVETIPAGVTLGTQLAAGPTVDGDGNPTTGLRFLNGESSKGIGWVVYDGRSEGQTFGTIDSVAGLTFGAGVDINGLDEDLLRGAPTGFFTFAGEDFDQIAPGSLEFSAFAWDVFGNTVSYFEEINPLTFTPILQYSQFRSNWADDTSGLDGFDFGRVAALAFRVESTQNGFDGRITAITATPIPLPASALLLLGGLGGMAGWSVAAKRRRKT